MCIEKSLISLSLFKHICIRSKYECREEEWACFVSCTNLFTKYNDTHWILKRHPDVVSKQTVTVTAITVHYIITVLNEIRNLLTMPFNDCRQNITNLNHSSRCVRSLPEHSRFTLESLNLAEQVITSDRLVNGKGFCRGAEGLREAREHNYPG